MSAERFSVRLSVRHSSPDALRLDRGYWAWTFTNARDRPCDTNRTREFLIHSIEKFTILPATDRNVTTSFIQSDRTWYSAFFALPCLCVWIIGIKVSLPYVHLLIRLSCNLNNMVLKAVCVLKGTGEVTGTVHFEQQVKWRWILGISELEIYTLGIALAHWHNLAS